MQFKRTKMLSLDEIKRLISLGNSNRTIAHIMRCSRSKVAAVRAGKLNSLSLEQDQLNTKERDWASKLDLKLIEEDLKANFPIKFIWEEKASFYISYINFYKYIKIHFKELFSKTSTLRVFNPAEIVEVDYMGDKIKWVDLKGTIHYASVFISTLCFSQYLYALAVENEKQENWLLCNRKMLEFYGGVPKIIRPDNLKTAVQKANHTDPEINADYNAFARHYQVTICPARAAKPKDKALVENSVGILQRYFKFKQRHKVFKSLEEVNELFVGRRPPFSGLPH